MPSILDNRKPAKVVLDSDKKKEEGKQPTFLVKRLTMKETEGLTYLLDNLGLDSDDPSKMFRDLTEALSEVIVGWFNMGDFKFEETKMNEFLSVGEAIELLSLTLYQGQASDEEKN